MEELRRFPSPACAGVGKAVELAAAAHHLGFADAAYFSRFFAKQAGQSPREFRPLKREAFR